MDEDIVESLKLENAELKQAIESYNAKMAKVPHLEKPPASLVEALLFLADWFDVFYAEEDVKTGDKTLQDDLRRWARIIGALSTNKRGVKARR